jgi:hypothetical protein
MVINKNVIMNCGIFIVCIYYLLRRIQSHRRKCKCPIADNAMVGLHGLAEQTEGSID